MPVPSEISDSTAVPLRTPSPVLASASRKSPKSRNPAERPLTVPLAVRSPVAPPRLASSFSVNPSADPALLIGSTRDSVSPTWWAPKLNVSDTRPALA